MLCVPPFGRERLVTHILDFLLDEYDAGKWEAFAIDESRTMTRTNGGTKDETTLEDNTERQQTSEQTNSPSNRRVFIQWS